MKLDQKVAIVVGSTSGIGKGIAKEFAAEGAVVIITGRRVENGEAVVKEIEAAGGKAAFMKLDAMDTDACRALIDEVVEKYGKLDILAYNAGVANAFSVTDGTEKDWDMIFNTNIRSAFFMSQHALPYLEATKGNIVYTASIGGVSAKATLSNIAYGSTTAAIIQMMKILALTVADKGIRVNAIAPGVTMTEMIEKADQSVIDRLKKAVPLQRIGTVQEMAKAAVYLASEDASFITGQALSLCGGMSIG